MASAAMIHFGLDPGKLVRWLGGEYIGALRDVNRTLTAVKDHVSADDFSHITRILMDGSPGELTFDEPLANKTLMIQRGNSKSFNENQDLVIKTMNKEDRYSHVLPFDELLCAASPYCRHTTQTLVIKQGKNDRLAFDASTTRLPTDIILNQITPIQYVRGNFDFTFLMNAFTIEADWREPHFHIEHPVDVFERDGAYSQYFKDHWRDQWLTWRSRAPRIKSKPLPIFIKCTSTLVQITTLIIWRTFTI
jgi:hypothetical protein